MKDSDLSIFSVLHRPSLLPNCDFIKPIQVGKIFTGINMEITSDDTGDNIAYKNDTFSELTALYWIWKRLDDIDSSWIGLCHYRRYFILPEKHLKKGLFKDKIIIDTCDAYSKPMTNENVNLVGAPSIQEAMILALEAGKVIVPKASHLSLDGTNPSSIKMHYIYCHIKEDWDLMRCAVIKVHPELEILFDDFFDHQYTMHCFNMFIAGKVTFASYCSWLFPILFELEKTVKLSEYPYQRRIFGFFSERLFNLYLNYQKLEVQQFPIVLFT